MDWYGKVIVGNVILCKARRPISFCRPSFAKKPVKAGRFPGIVIRSAFAKSGFTII